MINEPGMNYTEVGPWIQEIKRMLHRRSDFRVLWVSHPANVAAHKLAKVGVGDELCKVWAGVPPVGGMNPGQATELGSFSKMAGPASPREPARTWPGRSTRQGPQPGQAL